MLNFLLNSKVYYAILTIFSLCLLVTWDVKKTSYLLCIWSNCQWLEVELVMIYLLKLCWLNVSLKIGWWVLWTRDWMLAWWFEMCLVWTEFIILSCWLLNSCELSWCLDVVVWLVVTHICLQAIVASAAGNHDICSGLLMNSAVLVGCSCTFWLRCSSLAGSCSMFQGL